MDTMQKRSVKFLNLIEKNKIVFKRQAPTVAFTLDTSPKLLLA